MAEHNDTGRWGEQVACDYLRRQGYTIRARDWHYGHRDLDIVALSGDMTTLVVVEVKTRSCGCVVRPEDAVDRKKIRNIGIAADAYVKQNGIMLDLRFDIVTVVGDRTGKEEPYVEHWEDAFNPMLVY